MKNRVIVTALAAIAAVALAVSVADEGTVARPGPPGGELPGQLAALRGANDLVRATRTDVGRDPALYPTAYGRLEAALAPGHRTGASIPAVRPDALADLARTEALDTPAWRAHYVCLSLEGSRSVEAAEVLDRAGIRQSAEREALAYLRAPDPEDDALTSLATRAAFVRTLACLGHGAPIPRGALERLAADAARTDRPVPALHAVEALRAAGVDVRATRVLRDADVLSRTDCARQEPIQRAALTLLSQRLTASTRVCLKPSLSDPDSQTRWLVRRALRIGAADSAASLPAPVDAIRSDGLVAKSPAQLGTLTATYNAARALTAGARQQDVPAWLTKKLTRMGSDPGLEPSDRILLAMTCHRLSLDCGPQADQGAEEASALTVPARLTAENQRGWYGAMAARAEFGLGCRATAVDLPADEGAGLSSRSLRVIVVLADAGCTAQARRLADGADLVAQAREALREGDLPGASDAVEAALASDQSIPQTFWDDLPGLVRRCRDAEFPDLYADSPGGAATADATRAAYYLLA
ncbi:hypothetical protein ACIPSE_19070 [Streptomyces sp. NPDC090106]|uniref:hypothetical protein n=1 Tax=Streptomyces sp. NPDC090106 TaxID=3365946 RepID=UPI00381F0AA8